MNNKYITPVLVVALIGTVGAAAFFAGMRFDDIRENTSVEAFEHPHMRGTGFRHMRNRFQTYTEAGKVVEKKGNTITIQRSNGLTEKIIITGDTDVTRTSQATLSDLQVGDDVMVFAQEENGELSAEVIEINPLTRKWIFE